MTKQRQPLKPKEINFVKGIVAGKPKQRAAQDATGASMGVAAVQANRMLKNVNVQDAIAKAFKKHGITIDKAVKPIADGLEATKAIVMGKESNESFVDII